jgi:ribosomal protein S18 acetylase RimI-like enzyme
MTTAPSHTEESTCHLDPCDAEQLAIFCQRCTEYFQLVEGRPGGPATAAEILGPLPEKVTSGTKHVLGFKRRGEIFGVAELVEGFPKPTDWYVGLLLLVPEERHSGTGTRIWNDLRQMMLSRGAGSVRLIVQQQNPLARRFWERQGFALEGETTTQVGTLASPVWKMILAVR